MDSHLSEAGRTTTRRTHSERDARDADPLEPSSQNIQPINPVALRGLCKQSELDAPARPEKPLPKRKLPRRRPDGDERTPSSGQAREQSLGMETDPKMHRGHRKVWKHSALSVGQTHADDRRIKITGD